jgi:hypothetical protein
LLGKLIANWNHKGYWSSWFGNEQARVSPSSWRKHCSIVCNGCISWCRVRRVW